jgi:Icc-related predicted phosphoesterase
VRLVCISDTHNLHDRIAIPDGDVLIHAGDMTNTGSLEEIAACIEFLAALPHRHKVVIAGNHDFAFQREPAAVAEIVWAVTYLQDAAAEIGGLRFWGSPWQPWFFDWAFNLERGAAIRAKWDLIPDGVDVLITHGPPLGHLDLTDNGRSVGCADLLDAVHRVRPRLHVFGHIHEAYGVTAQRGTKFVNACSCDLRYRPINPAVVVDL